MILNILKWGFDNSAINNNSKYNYRQLTFEYAYFSDFFCHPNHPLQNALNLILVISLRWESKIKYYAQLIQLIGVSILILKIVFFRFEDHETLKNDLVYSFLLLYFPFLFNSEKYWMLCRASKEVGSFQACHIAILSATQIWTLTLV